MAIDAILERLALEDVLEVQLSRLRALALDHDRPGLARTVFRCVDGGVALVRAEFVEVVVGGDLLPGVRLLGRAEGASHRRQLASVRRRLLSETVSATMVAPPATIRFRMNARRLR